MKIGVFGGTFNPPHLGHENILKQSILKLNLDLVLVIPNNIPSHKKLPKNTAKTLNRLEMTEIMCQNIEKAQVSTIEIDMGGESYTIKTLEKILQKYEKCEIFLIIGSDSFIDFEKWREFEKILSLSTIVVLKRDLNEDLCHTKSVFEKKYDKKIILLDNEIIEISSSEIRKHENKNLLNKDVLKYIVENDLYKE